MYIRETEANEASSVGRTGRLNIRHSGLHIYVEAN